MTLRAAVAAVSGLFQPRYRPEAHYMRGPGPACAAKRAREAAREAGAATLRDALSASDKSAGPAH